MKKIERRLMLGRTRNQVKVPILVTSDGKIITKSLSTTLIVPAITAAAYSSQMCVGGKLTLTDIVQEVTGHSYLDSITITDRDAQSLPMTLLIFGSDPTTSTLTNNATAVITDADDVRIMTKVDIVAGDYSAIGTGKTCAQLSDLRRLVQASSNQTLYAALIAQGSKTFTGTTKLQVRLGFVHIH